MTTDEEAQQLIKQAAFDILTNVLEGGEKNNAACATALAYAITSDLLGDDEHKELAAEAKALANKVLGVVWLDAGEDGLSATQLMLVIAALFSAATHVARILDTELISKLVEKEKDTASNVQQ